MSLDLAPLAGSRKALFNVPLVPVQGGRFQPTGFPDLGAATYQSGATPCLLVESAQSMANRLELTIWDPAQNELREFVRGLSYVRVNDQAGNYLTSSIEEAHRLNSVYIENADKSTFHAALREEIVPDDNRPIDRLTFLKTVLKYDANSLLHGVFLESVDGRLRVARALSAFIEAEQVQVAASGGVKNDAVKPGTESGSERTAAEGYGNVPYHREEYTAGTITAYFNLDLGQIRGYGLGDEVEEMLTLLGLYKIRAFLEGDLRLRTACDFAVAGNGIASTDGFALPSRPELEGALTAAIGKCAECFGGDNGVTTVTYDLS